MDNGESVIHLLKAVFNSNARHSFLLIQFPRRPALGRHKEVVFRPRLKMNASLKNLQESCTGLKETLLSNISGVKCKAHFKQYQPL